MNWILILSLFYGPHAKADFAASIIGGRVVSAASTRAIVRVRTPMGGCTGTLIGPRVLLTAAHCLGDAEADVEITVAGSKIEARAIASELYEPNEVNPLDVHDVALALLDREIEGVKPIAVGGYAEEGTEVLLYGYGCRKKGGGPSDGKLRRGKAEITSVGEHVFRVGEGAVLCSGDSGGPAMMRAPGGDWVVVGVHSTSDLESEGHAARMDIGASWDFLREFAEDHDVGICGLNLDC